LPTRFGDQLFGLIRPFHSRRETIGAGDERVKLRFGGIGAAIPEGLKSHPRMDFRDF
jgi:hypothetical protein